MSTQPPAGADPNYGFTPCYRHPDRLTGVRCVRCDRPICPECQRPASVGFQCPDDVAAGRASVRQARTPVGALVSGSGPVVTYGLIAANVVVYLVTALSPGADFVSNSGSKLFADWDLVPYYIGTNHEYYRLVTSAFLHDGLLHILFNMYALYVIGPTLELVLGRWRYAAVYLLGALGGSVATLLFADPLSATIGASGAIFGLFAAALVLSRTGIGFDTRMLLITIGINFAFTFSLPGISKEGHLGWFVLGGLATLALLGWTLRRRPIDQRLRQVQYAGLAGLLVLLIVASLLRGSHLGSEQVQVYGVPNAAAVHSSTVWTPLGRTTPV